MYDIGIFRDDLYEEIITFDGFFQFDIYGLIDHMNERLVEFTCEYD